MTIDFLISLFHQFLAPGVFCYALYGLVQRPRDYHRLAVRARWAMAPGWAVLTVCLVVACVLFPAKGGLFGFLFQWAFPSVVYLLMAQVCLMAGSIWVWRGGLRGRGFGWMGAPRRWLGLFPWAPILAGAVIAHAVTLALMLLSRSIPIQPDPELNARLTEAKEIGGNALNALLISQLLIAPFYEEALFRHFLQSRLAGWFVQRGYCWFWSCIIASALWAIGHQGMLEPAWVKFSQIFLIGLVLGILQRRYGVWSAIAVHLCLNVGILFYGHLLLQPLGKG